MPPRALGDPNVVVAARIRILETTVIGHPCMAHRNKDTGIVHMALMRNYVMTTGSVASSSRAGQLVVMLLIWNNTTIHVRNK
jgi:hypothetical protein